MGNVIITDIKFRLIRLLSMPHLVFTAIAIPAGLIMTFLMPPFMNPDELVHFQRAYQVAHGGLASETREGKTGGVVPTISNDNSNTRDARHFWDKYYYQRVDGDKLNFVAFPNSAVYSPISYIPQAIGMRISEVIYPSVGLMTLLGRLFNLTAFIGLLYLAIKVSPRGKWVYAVIGLLPMAIHQAASLSSDAITIGAALFAVAYIHRLFLSKKKLNRESISILVVITLVLCLTKPTNVVLLVPLLFLPTRLFENNRQRLLTVASLIGTGLFVAGGWYLVGKLLHYDMHFSPYDADTTRQLQYILQHPFEYLKVLFETYVYSGANGSGVMFQEFFFGSFVGYFSWLSYKLPMSSILLAYSALFIALFYREPTKLLKKYENNKALIITYVATFFLSLIAIASALYLTWTTVGGDHVDGIQGRYFIPLVPLLIPLAVLLQQYLYVSIKKPFVLGLIFAVISIFNIIVMFALTLEWFYF